jgi:von Willebrand factor type A domain
VVLVDRSYSMAYGDRWARAVDAARNAATSLGPADRASIVFFSTGAQVALRSTGDRERLMAAIATGKASAGATRYGPALKLAGSILSESPLPRREAILISDFQKSGWQGADGVRLPDGAVVTPVPIGSGETANVAVTPVSLQRSAFSGQERIAVTAGVINRGARPVSGLDVTLEVAGRAQQTQRVNVDANGSASITFTPFTPEGRDTRGTVRIANDALVYDNAFHFVVEPKRPLKLIIAERGGSAGNSLYLSRALSLADAPPVDVSVRAVESLSSDDLSSSAVVVLNDVPVSTPLADRLARFVERGGGLFVVLGGRAAWPGTTADILPAQPGTAVDRTRGNPARLGALEYGHSVFEPFRAPRSGDFSSARFYGYRAVTLGSDGKTIARFDDGAPALVERRVGAGRVLMWTSSLDVQWNDLALKPVFLPFVHRAVRHLAAYEERASWSTVGDVFEPTTGREPRTGRVALTPGGQRLGLDEEGADVLALDEQGFYEIRAQGRETDPPMTVASNVDLSESDLTPMDPQELVAAATGRAGSAVVDVAGGAPTDEAHERAQKVWWNLLFAGLVLLGVETVVANRLTLRG